ncbi:MAG: hypothetical protein BA863_01835 [Desulfovibrio sp. S3730MH75]|nr:MAG: hypothetical protein BA863_01835 [Desulfovibrio sp. S3730MH75]
MHSKQSQFGRKAHALLKGVGIEIGALHCPFDLDATVMYLDRHSKKDLIETYKNDPRQREIKDVHLISKSDYYAFIDDNAFDFVVSSHVLEHTCNPGRVIEEWIRIVKQNGIVYMVVPDKNFCFDRKRHLTTIEHLMKDFHDKTGIVAFEHYDDFFTNTQHEEGIRRNQSKELTSRAFKKQDSIHVHTFTHRSLRVFLIELQRLVPFTIIHFEAQNLNIHVALRKELR